MIFTATIEILESEAQKPENLKSEKDPRYVGSFLTRESKRLPSGKRIYVDTVQNFKSFVPLQPGEQTVVLEVNMWSLADGKSGLSVKVLELPKSA